MKELSLLAGKAASSGESVAGCTSSSQKVKNIIADTSVATAHSAASSSAGSESMTCTSAKGLIQNVEIPLKTIFLHVLKSLGIHNPVFTKVHFSEIFQVHIQLQCGLPCPRQLPVRNATISCDVCPDSSTAEAGAIKKAL